MIIKNEDEWENFHLKENNARKTTQVRIITTHNNNFFFGNKHHLKEMRSQNEKLTMIAKRNIINKNFFAYKPKWKQNEIIYELKKKSKI